MIIPQTEPMTNENATAEAWLCPITKSVAVAIRRGENNGHTFTYHNVVRSFAAVGKWSGDALTLRLPAKGQPGENSDGIVVWVQSGEMGQILGAAQIKQPAK